MSPWLCGMMSAAVGVSADVHRTTRLCLQVSVFEGGGWLLALPCNAHAGSCFRSCSQSRASSLQRALKQFERTWLPGQRCRVPQGPAFASLVAPGGVLCAAVCAVCWLVSQWVVPGHTAPMVTACIHRYLEQHPQMKTSLRHNDTDSPLRACIVYPGSFCLGARSAESEKNSCTSRTFSR